eukprot:NODE_1460_length_1136_cov_711.808511.p1 GENE.NODE_1460_length_1136_cov_711.808511~~NODE_1460_length_1136_cov_711.808511.p1  ORF type:complete len:259 (-),score=65.64 NODE_1460_length_1136_cov_711.808511:342-1118(-)
MGALNSRELRTVSHKQALWWCVVPVLFTLRLCSSLVVYKYFTLSSTTVLGNLTPLITLPLESAAMPAEHRPVLTPWVLTALFMMAIGATIYSHEAPLISIFGLLFLVLHCLADLINVVVQRRLLVKECRDLPLSACVAMNNAIGIFPTLVMLFIAGEPHALQEHEAEWRNQATITLIMMSGLAGLAISYYGLACQKEMSATSFVVLQNASKVAVVAIGVGVFGDQVFTVWRLAGMSASLLGSLLYGLARLQATGVAVP